MLYFITCQPNGNFQNNAIAGVPSPGPCSIYNYFSDAHPIFYKLNYSSFDKITSSMILIKYHLDLKQFFNSMVTDINMNDFLTDNTFNGSFSKTITIFIPS